MRAALLTAAFVALGVGVASVPAQAADIYGPPPAYGAAPPPAYRPAPPVAYVTPPPVYGPPPVVAYGPPPGVIAAPEGPAYIVQQPAYQPGSEYERGRPPDHISIAGSSGASAVARWARAGSDSRNIAGSRNASARACVALRGGTETSPCVNCCSPARPLRSPRFRASPPRKSTSPTCYPPAAGVVVRPPVVAAPMVESQVYLAPGTTYVQPGRHVQPEPNGKTGRSSSRASATIATAGGTGVGAVAS